jgi:hypothetical protein
MFYGVEGCRQVECSNQCLCAGVIALINVSKVAHDSGFSIVMSTIFAAVSRLYSGWRLSLLSRSWRFSSGVICVILKQSGNKTSEKDRFARRAMSGTRITLQRFSSDVGLKSLGDDLDGVVEISLRTSSSLTGGSVLNVSPL